MRLAFLLTLLVLLALRPAAAQQSARDLLPHSELVRHGLVRNWTAQLEMSPSRHRVLNVAQEEGLLLINTSNGLLHALDAESGRRLWVAEVPRAGNETLEASASKQHVVVVSGTTLRVLRRTDGTFLYDWRLDGVPAAPPLVTDLAVLVPLSTGLVDGFFLPEPNVGFSANVRLRSLSIDAEGTPTFQPLWTHESIVVPTARGNVFFADPITMRERFQFTAEGLVTRPSYTPPYVYVASANGYLHAVHETKGDQPWVFSVGDTVRQPPYAFGDVVYVFRDSGGMFALHNKTGQELWYAPRVERLIAASPTRIYTIDRRNKVTVLDTRTGAAVDAFYLGIDLVPFANSQTDRIYLVSRGGLVQCLHERELDLPLNYSAPRPVPVEDEKPQQKPKTPAAAPAADTTPAAPADAPAAPMENPFGDDPEPASEDNPFGADPEPAAEMANPFG